MKQNLKDAIKRLTNQYRLVILNKDTFEERVSLNLTRLNVVLIVVVLMVIFVLGTVLMILYTPLKDYMVGDSPAQRKRIVGLTLRMDSLERVLDNNKFYIESVQQVIRGDIPAKKISEDTTRAKATDQSIQSIVKPIKEDSILRGEVELDDKFNIARTSGKEYMLHVPLSGKITSKYNVHDRHFGVDIAAPKDSPVKAVASGIVVFQEWSAETGHVIIIRHNNNVLSIYKHNSKVYKRQGDLVKSGEVIASVGNTGEYSSGYHLHFEIWVDGFPMDPQDVIPF